MKWRAELRERELERMSMLEREWRRREATRTAEVAQIKAHYAKLDSQTRQVSGTTTKVDVQSTYSEFMNTLHKKANFGPKRWKG